MVVFHLENYGQSVVACEEGPEGVKWEMGFAYFWVGKWDFMHWDLSAKNNRKWEWD